MVDINGWNLRWLVHIDKQAILVITENFVY